MSYNQFDIFEQIKSAFHLSSEESEAAFLLLKNYAGVRGTTIEKYFEFHHPDGFVKSDNSLSSSIKGYVKFLGDDAKSIIHAGQNANYSTFVHECSHIFRRQLEGKRKAQAEEIFGVQNGVWTREQDEAFASQLEVFIKTREAEEKKLALMQRGAKFVNDTYNGLNYIIDINPELKKVFEEMFYDSPYVFKQNEYDKTLKQIAETGSINDRGSIFLGNTPPLYEEIGLEQRPLMIREEKLYNVMTSREIYSGKHTHGLSVEILSQIPEKLKTPLFIVQSEDPRDAIVSVVELQDHNGNQIILPIIQNRHGKFDEINIDINLVSSIYGHSNFNSFMQRAINDNRLLYMDKKRVRTPLLSHSTDQGRFGTQGLKSSFKFFNIPDSQDISGFFINNISRYNEEFKQIEREKAKNEVFPMSGEEILFQINYIQGELDFGPELEPDRQEKKPQANSKTKDDAAHQAAEPLFAPVISGNIHDYTQIKANEILLRNDNSPQFRPPSYIPDISLEYMRYNKFLPPFVRDGENYLVQYKDASHDITYKMTAEVLAATVDYYVKTQKVINVGKGLNERVTFLPQNKMSRTQMEFLTAHGFSGDEAWKEYESLRTSMRQKMLDMSMQKEDWENAHSKGRETAYGDANTSKELLADFGVLVKRQNGDAITREEIHDVETALNSVSNVFGDLRGISEKYGLKISHAADKHMHARKALGLFNSDYHAVGVSFADKDAATFILAHESAHFLDFAAGKEVNHYFASDKEGTPEHEIASKFRAEMNQTLSQTFESTYLNRTCECFARAMQQYAAYTLRDEQFELYCQEEGYVKKEKFESIIIPLVENLKIERDNLWHPNIETNDNNQEVKPELSNEYKPFGAWVDFNKRLSVREREIANKAALTVLNKSTSETKESDREILKKYSGFGGIAATGERGVLYDYYTSPPIAKMTWDLLSKVSLLEANSKVLEPSCGTGVFFETAPAGTELTGVELDERTASIARKLHPGINIVNSSFESFNITNNVQYDHVIGNAPFGERSVETSFLDLPNEKSLDKYFVSRSIDKLRDGGTMALIVHPGVLENKSNEDWRLDITRKAQLAGAVKLNDNSFSHTHTSVQPAILLFRKLPQDIRNRLESLSTEELKSTPLYNTEFVTGNYFDKHTNHVMGEIDTGAGLWGSDIVKGNITPETLSNMLNTFLPEAEISENILQTILEAYSEKEVIEKKADSLLLLTAEESERLQNKKDLHSGALKIVISDDKTKYDTYILSDSFRWELCSQNPTVGKKLEIVQNIAAGIKDIRASMKEQAADTALLQSNVITTIEKYKEQYNQYPIDDADINRFLRQFPSVSGIYEAFVNIQSDILTSQNLYTQNGEFVNGHNISIDALFLLHKYMLPGTEENISRFFPETKDALIKDMYNNTDVFLNHENVWQLREDFLSGSAWEKIDALNSAIQSEPLTSKQEKLRYGVSELQNAIGWIAIEDADFTPHSSWIPETIINNWITSEDGLDRNLPDGIAAKNAEGKWGIVTAGKKEWQECNNEIIYYLNMQKQRSRYYDTETYNRDANENFKNYIANHAEHRDTLEKMYNRIFNTEISVPVKTYPVYLEGWKTESKTLRAHQWQSVHHLYREGKGISALGTGFGKTLAGAGLQTLLQQEQKIRRAWFQVPNNKVKDWVAEIKSVMPEKKIGFVDPEMPGYSSREKRFSLYQRLANNNYDIIIMPESAASEIQLSAENDERITNSVVVNQIADKVKSESSRKVQQTADSAQRKLQNGKTNKTICFEDFGCDALFVDEAHRYKNLFSSSLSRETGLNDGRQSNKAMALFKKAEYIRGEQNGKNVFLFTATPLTNSPLEYYNMLMYIAPEEMKNFGISTIDGFIKNFANIEQKQTYDWKSGQITEGRVLTGFKNIQTLQDVFFKYTDYQNDPQKINLQKPDANNKPNVIPQNEKQTSVLKELSDELAEYQSLDATERAKKFPGQNFLTFYTKMRTASLDLELYEPDKNKAWDNPKLIKLCNNAFNNYNATKGGQIIFCDRVFSSDLSFNMHDKIKSNLVKAGFKENEIIIVNGFTKSGGAKSDTTVEKDVSEAVAAYNSGKYKVLIGSTACVGEGLNLQDNSAALHHFDIPFRPSDFIQRNGRIDRQGNAQQNVELHTYMAAGTIDNYSVSLVEKKAGWIDKLLKTKSNVFVNEGDESFVDADELLLALTESWGDKELAGERRIELENRKAKALTEAQHNDRRNMTSSLALMKNSVLLFEGDKGTKAFQTRIHKIDNLEKALLNNPTFKDKELINSNEPFLYSKAGDCFIRKGDVIIKEGNVRIVTKLNLRKGEFVTESEKKTPSYLKDKFTTDTYTVTAVHSINKFIPGDNTVILHTPGKELIDKLKMLHTKDFYCIQDNDFKKDYYYHSLIAANDKGDSTPVYVSVDEDTKKLRLDTFHYYTEKNEVINPFTDEGKASLNKALAVGVILPDYNPENELETLKECIPSLHTAIQSRLLADELKTRKMPQERNIFNTLKNTPLHEAALNTIQRKHVHHF